MAQATRAFVRAHGGREDIGVVLIWKDGDGLVLYSIIFYPRDLLTPAGIEGEEARHDGGQNKDVLEHSESIQRDRLNHLVWPESAFI